VFSEEQSNQSLSAEATVPLTSNLSFVLGLANRGVFQERNPAASFFPLKWGGSAKCPSVDACLR
jgi:hypothetical protein